MRYLHAAFVALLGTFLMGGHAPPAWAQTCGSPVAIPGQPAGDLGVTLSREFPVGAPGEMQHLFVGGRAPYTPFLLLYSPNLSNPPINAGSVGQLFLDKSALTIVAAPWQSTNLRNWWSTTFHYNGPNVLWVQSLVYDPVLGKRLTPPRPIWNDLVCAFYDTFSSHPVGSPAQVPFWSWGNGNIIIDNVYQFTPGGGPPSVQMRPAVFSCLAGGMGLDTRPFASGQFAMNYWFAVDGTDTPGTCHDFRHKLMITPGGTTTGVRTIFEVKNDGSLIFHGTGTAMNTGKKLEFADSGNSWSGKWYVVTVHYAQVTPGTTDLGRLKFRIADNAGNLVWSLVDNDLGPVWIDLNPNEATYKSVLWECGNGRSTVDEVSFHY